jgi:hypothetical protein
MIRNDASRTPPRSTGPGRFKAAALSAAIGAFGALGAARADTVNLNYLGAGSGRIVHATLGTQSWDVFAGRLLHHTAGGTGGLTGLPTTITTFCVDLLQAHTSAPSTYGTSSIATLSGNTGLTNLGFAKQQAIYDIYQAAGNHQFTAGLDYATAFQVAIWEVVYDYSATLPNHGLSVTGGVFRATAPGLSSLSASISDKVQFLLGSVGVGASSHGLVGLRSSAYQDQLFVTDGPAVPLPVATWPAIVGLVLVALTQWRRRRAYA